MNDPGQWTASTPAGGFPRPIDPDEEIQERIKANLWQVGITEDPFADPEAGIRMAQRSKAHAVALYAAILHATKDTVTIVQSFSDWYRQMLSIDVS